MWENKNINSINTNKALAPSRDGIGKTLNSARFIASNGNNNKNTT